MSERDAAARGSVRGTPVRWVTAMADGVSIALDALRVDKIRSGLTILGVAVGVIVVMVMAAVIHGIERDFRTLMASRGVKTFYVFHASFAQQGVRTGLEEEEVEFLARDPIRPEWAKEVQELPGILEATPLADLGQSGYRGRWRGLRTELSLVAVGATFREMDAGEVSDGRFYSEVEARRGRPVAVIDTGVAANLYGVRDPLNRRIEIVEPRVDRSLLGGQGPQVARGRRSFPFRVVGVYRQAADLFSQLEGNYTYIPFEAARKYVDFWERLVVIVVRPEEETPLQAALDRVRGKMRQLRGLRPGQEDDFELITQAQVLRLWNDLTSVLFSVMVGLSSVGLMVGGVGVVGIMMISVTERTREIGVRKAIGARRRDILWQFLVEAATLTLLGGSLGMLLGGAVVWGLNTWTPVPASVPLWAVIAALAVAALTGVGFGLYPASRGARLDPVEALRYE